MLYYLQSTETEPNMLMSIVAFAILLGAVFLTYRLLKNMTKRAGQDK